MSKSPSSAVACGRLEAATLTFAHPPQIEPGGMNAQ